MRLVKMVYFGVLAIAISAISPSSTNADETTNRRQVEAAIREMSAYPFAYLEEGGEEIGMIQCRGGSIDLRLMRFTPAQAFPQPDLSLTFSQNTWTEAPYAHLRQGHPEIVVEFFPGNHVMGARQLFADLSAGTSIEVSFNGQSRKLSIAPSERVSFVKDCLKHFQFPK